jgi:hypothetical protein
LDISIIKATSSSFSLFSSLSFSLALALAAKKATITSSYLASLLANPGNTLLAYKPLIRIPDALNFSPLSRISLAFSLLKAIIPSFFKFFIYIKAFLTFLYIRDPFA